MRATLRFARISSQKVRPVVDMIRGKTVDEALIMLENTNRRASYFITKVLRSAVANAAENEKTGRDVSDLFIKEICVDQGPTIKRFRPRAQGRAYSILKRMTHLRVVLAEIEA